MRNNSLFIFLLFFLPTIQWGCSKEVTESNTIVTTIPEIKDYTLSAFAEILSEAVYNDNHLREFIKRESRKQFDNDYDVFYPFAKDAIIHDEMSFRDILLYYDKENKLPIIEDLEPFLTILVPDRSWVDASCFCADNWDTSSPEVAVSVSVDDNVLLYGNGTLMGSLPGNVIPSGPTLIVKRNERMVFNPTKSPEDAYSFVDSAFDGSLIVETKGKKYEHDFEYAPSLPNDFVSCSDFSSKLSHAYAESASAYYVPQRDNVYYNMTASKDTGSIDFHYVERLLKFRFSTGNISGLYDDTQAGTDINLVYNQSPGKSFSDEQIQHMIWCEGNIETVFHVIAGAREYRLVKSFRFQDAFEASKIHFEWYQGLFNAVTWRYYTIDPSTLVPKWINLDWSLFTWDLSQIPTAYCVWAEELDSGATISTTITYSNKYVTNTTKSLEESGGASIGGIASVNIKFGYGSGSSSENYKQESLTVTTKQENDDLGQTWVQYTDPIIRRIVEDSAELYRYSTGCIDFMIVPKQIY